MRTSLSQTRPLNPSPSSAFVSCPATAPLPLDRCACPPHVAARPGVATHHPPPGRTLPPPPAPTRPWSPSPGQGATRHASKTTRCWEQMRAPCHARQPHPCHHRRQHPWPAAAARPPPVQPPTLQRPTANLHPTRLPGIRPSSRTCLHGRPYASYRVSPPHSPRRPPLPQPGAPVRCRVPSPGSNSRTNTGGRSCSSQSLSGACWAGPIRPQRARAAKRAAPATHARPWAAARRAARSLPRPWAASTPRRFLPTPLLRPYRISRAIRPA